MGTCENRILGTKFLKNLSVFRPESVNNSCNHLTPALSMRSYVLPILKLKPSLLRYRQIKFTEAKDVWRLNDFLSAKRHEVDGKYDFRYPYLIVVFARLVKEGWLQPQELEGLDPSKRAKIAALSRM
ncbi:hypothetical protein [Brunnivagina elsteri]|uniref:hypothetical protein n=1 Tax=Brunnivagina elsteri TaxID=1247191 RepID=UPI001FEBD009